MYRLGLVCATIHLKRKILFAMRKADAQCALELGQNHVNTLECVIELNPSGPVDKPGRRNPPFGTTKEGDANDERR